MAMSLSLTALKINGISVKNPECVSKTYPDFFENLFPFFQNLKNNNFYSDIYNNQLMRIKKRRRIEN
jgi:hypothetical protein